MDKSTLVLGATTGILVLVVGLKVSGFTLVRQKAVSGKPMFALALPWTKKPTPTPVQTETVVAIDEILPPSMNLGVSWEEVIVKMVKNGAIDKQKLLQLYEGRQADLAEVKHLLDSPNNDEIVVTRDNAGLILNLLWPLGIANKTDVLSLGPMGTQYKNEIGNFASTGGWTLGAKDGGKLFNSQTLVQLTQEQEAMVTEIAQNIYRPCCGNSTYFPDCNHGAAMLGFIELAVASGMPKEEIYKKALVLNSYWFPQTYAEIATYMKAKRNLAWKDVDPKEALGVEFSSGQGAAKVNKELQTLGLLPSVSGGGGCGI